MNILVCAPMEQEAINFKEALIKYSLNTPKQHHYDVVNIGVGKVSAAAETAISLSNPHIKYSYDLITIVGYAAASSEYKIGDIVMPAFSKCYDVPESDMPIFEAMNKQYLLCGSDDCIILTGDKFVDNKLALELYKKYSKKVLFDMESAAVCQVASDTEIPILVMKMVSDVPELDHENDSSFTKFVEEHSDFLPFVFYLENL